MATDEGEAAIAALGAAEGAEALVAACGLLNAAYDRPGVAPPASWGKEPKQAALRALLGLVREPPAGDAQLEAVVRALKVISRSRTALQPLFEREAVEAAAALLGRADAPGLQLEATTLVSNMLVLDRANVLAVVGGAGGPAAMLDALEARAGDAAFAFIAARALFVACLDRPVAEPLVRDAAARERVLAAAAAACGGAEAGAPLLLPVPAEAEATYQARRAASELLKLLFALLSEFPWDEAPRECVALVRAVLSAGTARRDDAALDRRVARADTAEKRRKREAVRRAIAELREKDGDAAADAAAEEAGLGPLRNEEDDAEELARCEAPDGAPDEADPEAVREDAGARPRDLTRPTLVDVRSAAANLLLYLPKEQAVARVAADLDAVQGVMEVLDASARRPVKSRGDREGQLTPVCMALNELVQRGDEARQYVKRYLFGELASPDEEKRSEPLTMQPQGQKTERRDPAPAWVKGVLLNSLTSFSMHLKTAVEELMWKLCQEESHDYIRLCGFGNAVGLLANKGMPGFAHLGQNAIDIDALMAAKKRKEEAGGEAQIEEVLEEVVFGARGGDEAKQQRQEQPQPPQDE